MPLRDETIARVLNMWRNPTDRVKTVSVIDICGERRLYASPPMMTRLAGVELSLDGVIAALGDDAGEVIGEVRLAYADESVACLDPRDGVEKVADDDPRVAAMGTAADPYDWQESSGGEASDGRFLLCEGGVVTAMASYGIWDETIGSIGVFTPAEHRGRGLSPRVASAAVAEVFARGFPAQWQWRATNTGSGRVGEKLGFVTLGGREVVRVRPRPA